MDILTLLYLRAGRRVICAFIALLLTAAGTIHLMKLPLAMDSLVDSRREYLMHCAAGLLFGWMFAEGLFAYARNWLAGPRSNFPPGPALAVIAPVVFLVTLHQTRYFLNDGPATFAMAVGVLMAGMSGGRSAVPGIDIPESFLLLIEAGKMDADFSAGIVNSLHAMDQYNPRLFDALAAIHRRRGNVRKAGLAARVAELLRDDVREK